MDKMDRFASTPTGKDVVDSSDECPFGSAEEDFEEWVEQEDGCGCS